MARDDLPTSVTLARLRRAARVGAVAESVVARATRPVRTMGFPYRAPLVPHGVEVPEKQSTLGADFDTDWARKMPARILRSAVAEGPVRLSVKLLADPEVLGVDRLADLRRAEDPPAVIFAPNHHSHLDTALMAVAVPEPWRSKMVVAAAADYFFDKRLKGVLSALALNAIPIDRESTGRKSSDQLRKLIEDGWSLMIYPEGGRSPDGWGQEFKGGAAYLAGRTGMPVVPVFIDGTGAIFGKGMKRPKPGKTKVIFGAPLRPLDGESTRRFAPLPGAPGPRLRIAILSLLALAAASSPQAGAADKAEGPATPGETKRVRWASAPPVKQNTYRVQRMKDNPTIDADWNKAAWKGVTPVTLEYYMGEEPAHQPKVQAKAAYDDHYLYLIWKVEDKYVLAKRTKHQQDVWRDSCVEFFFTPGGDPKERGYFNLETNCAGVKLFGAHVAGSKDEKFTAKDFASVVTANSLKGPIDPEIAQADDLDPGIQDSFEPPGEIREN